MGMHGEISSKVGGGHGGSRHDHGHHHHGGAAAAILGAGEGGVPAAPQQGPGGGGRGHGGVERQAGGESPGARTLLPDGHIPGPYGENLRWSGFGDSTGTPAFAMSYWVGERPYYDYRSNNCLGGRECRHYTQVVWRRTAYVGCARVTCNTNNGIGTIIACNYYPRGNIYNERPY
uniref:SCP domain-containing protein n=1 Tax=Oryza barthii TaxID=65489 RepID=A0A0D3GYD1_9ORYZ